MNATHAPARPHEHSHTIASEPIGPAAPAPFVCPFPGAFFGDWTADRAVETLLTIWDDDASSLDDKLLATFRELGASLAEPVPPGTRAPRGSGHDRDPEPAAPKGPSPDPPRGPEPMRAPGVTPPSGGPAPAPSRR
jgi:hypothetical protein